VSAVTARLPSTSSLMRRGGTWISRATTVLAQAHRLQKFLEQDTHCARELIAYTAYMSIILPAEHKTWLEAQVAAGHFASVEEAVAVAIADLKAAAEDDLTWAKPLVEKARRSVAAGDAISGDEFIAELEDKAASLRTR